MTSIPATTRATRARLAAALLLCATAWLPTADAAPDCARPAECLDAIMDAAGAGQLLDEMSLMNALLRHNTADSANRAAAPGGGAALGRTDVDALADGLASDPTSSADWLALATAYARQGRHARAVEALVLADTWAADPASVRREYAAAVRGSGAPHTVPDYAAALKIIADNEARESDEDAELAPLPLDAGPRIGAINFNSCTRPADPRTGAHRQDSGTTQIGFLIDGDGKVRRVRKVRSSGHVELDNAAVLALSACKFRHALPRDGKLLAGWVRVQYVWTAP